MNRPTRTRRISRITELRVKNFRSIADATLSLPPITALVGPNASGKSNVMDALRFVGEAVRVSLDSALTSRDGIGGIRRWQRGGRPFNIEIGLKVKSGIYSIDYKFIVAGDPDRGYRVREEQGEISRLHDNEVSSDFQIKNGKVVSPKWLLTDNQNLEEEEDFETTSLAMPTLVRLSPFRSLGRDREDPRLAMRSALIRLRRVLSEIRCYHIFPNTLRQPQFLLSPYPLGEGGENLATVLRDMQKKSPEAMELIKQALKVLVPGVTDLRVTQAGRYLVTQLRHTNTSHRGANPWFDLSQESDGTLRLLGLLVALYQHPYLGFIGIEEPELTVHPGALAALADVLQEASRRSQILVTTHSPDLIDRLSTDQLRVVKLVKGVTEIGSVLQTQAEAVRQNLFSPGELHRIEGLEPDFRN